MLHLLAKHDVVAMLCDWRGVPEAGLYPWLSHSRIGARQRAQAELSRPRSKNAWMQLVRAKIRGQATTLGEIDELAADHLLDLARRVRSGDPGNVEAAAARWYWGRLFADHDFVRDPESEDAVNSRLNYGYGVLRGYGVRAVTTAGLAPSLGVFHRNRSNPFNLVEDLIEPFRPFVDAVTAAMPINAEVVDPEVKAALVGAMTRAYSASGASAATELDALAQRYGGYVEGDIDVLRVPIWRGVDDRVSHAW